jgi:hypothetical protein
MAGLPNRLPSGIDIKLALQGYCDALADCHVDDLTAIVRECVIGVPTTCQWAPDAATVRQLCRDKQAKREAEGMTKIETAEKTVEPPTEDEYDRMAAKAAKLIDELVADKDARKTSNWAYYLARRQPADGDYGWRKNIREKSDDA